MAFPYLAPVKEWVVKVLRDREYSTDSVDITAPVTIKNNFNSVLKMPFAILTSGAKVTQVSGLKGLDAEARAKKLEELYKNNQASSTDYLGCIIRNDLDKGAKYQLDESYIGVDFAGKKIKTIGESNRRISTPIIENIEIDTDGANNTLKVAKVNVRCFSLKQFEMFELFFCRPGMNVLVEFGDNTLDTYRFGGKPKDAYNDSASVSSLLFPKNDYQKFIDVFSSYYRFTNTSFKLFQQHVEKSLGSYDFVAGKVTDYSFAIDADGTYTVSLDVSQGNQMSLAIPVNIGNNSASSETPSTETEEFNQWISQLAANLDIAKGNLDVNESDYKKEFFNWGKVSDTKKDETASTEKYISLRFILKKLMNYSLHQNGYESDTFEFRIPTYNVGLAEQEYIPIRSHVNLISSNTDILYPNKEMVTFRAPITNSSIKEGDEIQISNKTINASINGYSINDGVDVKDSNGNIINPKTSDGTCCGNALNIFVNYKVLVQSWKASYSRMDFLEAILDTINKNSFGKFRLVRANHTEGVSASIVDYTGQSDVKIEREVYRFNVNTIKSNVIDFTFNFEMSNLVAGRTVFNAQRFLVNALKDLKKDDKELEVISLPPSIFQEFDNSMMSNADGFFSLNMIDLKALEANFKDSVKKDATPPEDPEEKPNEAKNYTDIIESKSIKFKFKDGIKVIIFTDADTIKKKLSSPKDDIKTTLSPIEITLVIDGINGFNCGEYFRINGVPEIYNQIGVFQITNTKHSVASEGWRTTLEAQFRITPKQ